MKTLFKNNIVEFKDFLDKIRNKYYDFMRKNGDVVIIISGMEGSGKSLLGLAIGTYNQLANESQFVGNHVYYGGGEYTMAILGAYKTKTQRWSPQQLEKYNKKNIIIDMPDEKIDRTIVKGTNLLYDEGSQGLFNRTSMSGDQIDQVTVFTINRVLNLAHLICIPDPSTLEKYIKKFRVKMFIWVQEIGDKRMAYIWNKRAFNKMSLRNDFDEIVSGGIDRMQKISRPNFYTEIPPLMKVTTDPQTGYIKYESTGYISADILEYYHINKDFEGMNAVSNMGIIKKHVEQTNGDNKPAKKLSQTMCTVIDGENKEHWFKRTNKNPTHYYQYGGKKEWRDNKLWRCNDNGCEICNPEKEKSDTPSIG